MQISTLLEALPISDDEKIRRFRSLTQGADDSTDELVRHALKGS